MNFSEVKKTFIAPTVHFEVKIESIKEHDNKLILSHRLHAIHSRIREIGRHSENVNLI